jgi:hypothetical protein
MANKTTQAAVSDFNLQKLNTQELSKHLNASIRMGGNVAIFGRRGTGKTEIAKQEIKNLKKTEVYINLSVMERVDLGGYPNVMAGAQNKKFVEFLLPSFYERMFDEGKEVVALLDEVDKADPSLWAPLLEFTQFKSINGKKLPALKAVIMTGNLISEGGSRPSVPLLDRAEKYLVEADATHWLNWAGKVGGIHPSITSYINDNPQHLLGAVDPIDRYADQSPRGWTNASRILVQGENLGLDPNMLNAKVSGCIGKEVGLKYSSYYEYYKQLLPMIDDIFNGVNVKSRYKTLEPTKKLVSCMITCARLASKLDQLDKKSFKSEEPPVYISNVGKFLQDVTYENVLVAVRSQITLERLMSYNLDEHKDWEAMLSDLTKKMDE